MSVCSDVADYVWLTGSEAAAILADLAVSDLPLHTSVSRLRRSLSPERTHLLVELLELRRRAAAKFPAADHMFFTRTALEQATDVQTARYKAQRFFNRFQSRVSRTLLRKTMRTPLFADLCCGIGGDLLALAVRGSIVAVDSNPVAIQYAEANIRAVNPSADVRFHMSDAAEFALEDVDAWHIDPDRRLSGRRTTSLDACRPDRAAIDRLLERAPSAAIKLAPATKVPSTWARHCELEWISQGGECRQLVAWHGELAECPGQHRATILSGCEAAPRSLTGNPQRAVPIAVKLHEHVYDFDPAVHAANLQGALAAAINACALGPGPTYYTGSATITNDLALSCFQVEDVLPLRIRELAKYLRARCVGALEIKKRGVNIEPETLRRELKLRGENSASLLITNIGGRPKVIVARRIV